MRIVFQGDSITDWYRDREDFHSLGKGYPVFCAQMLRDTNPETEFEFINRGISGDHVDEVLKRWESECLEYNPDIVTLLVGINDVGSEASNLPGYSSEQFERDYRKMMEMLKAKLNCKLIIMEPFMLRNDPNFGIRYPILAERIEIIRRIAKEYADRYIALDGIFAEKYIIEDAEFWSPDGVHPSDEGAKVIAKALCETINSII